MALKWLQSNQGKTVTVGAVAVGTSAVGYAHIALHTYFLSSYRRFMHMYSHGFEIPVPKELDELAQKVFVDSDLLQRDVDMMQLFTVVGLDVFGAGSTKLRKGAIIGLPYHFRYTREEDVETSLLKVKDGQEPFERTTPMGKAIIDSLVLSSAAKRFAIAREIHSCNTNRHLLAGFGTTFTLSFGYVLGVFLNSRFQYQTRMPLMLRAATYTVCGTIGVVICLMMNDAVHVYYDAKCDAAAARLGRDYAVGGVEYYEKQVERNKALHKILGDVGEKYYTAGGNFNSWIRTKSLPPVTRLDNVRLQLEKYGEAQNSL